MERIMPIWRPATILCPELCLWKPGCSSHHPSFCRHWDLGMCSGGSRKHIKLLCFTVAVVTEEGILGCWQEKWVRGCQSTQVKRWGSWRSSLADGESCMQLVLDWIFSRSVLGTLGGEAARESPEAGFTKNVDTQPRGRFYPNRVWYLSWVSDMNSTPC